MYFMYIFHVHTYTVDADTIFQTTFVFFLFTPELIQENGPKICFCFFTF